MSREIKFTDLAANLQHRFHISSSSIYSFVQMRLQVQQLCFKLLPPSFLNHGPFIIDNAAEIRDNSRPRDNSSSCLSTSKDLIVMNAIFVDSYLPSIVRSRQWRLENRRQIGAISSMRVREREREREREAGRVSNDGSCRGWVINRKDSG